MKRRLVAGLVVSAAFGALATAAASAAPPAWPTAGFRPTCDSFQQAAGVPYALTYNDNTPPLITSATISHKNVVGPDAKARITITATATDHCSGVGAFGFYLKRNGTSDPIGILPVTNNDAFHAKVVFVAPATPLNTPPMVITLDRTAAWDRYSTFTLDASDKLLNSTPRNPATDIGSLWAGPPQNCYVVQESRLVAKPSAVSVRKGTVVHFVATLTYWSGSGFTPNAGVQIRLQRRIGSGKWMLASKEMTSAAGKAVFVITPTKTASYQVVFAADLAKGQDIANTKPVVVAVH